MLRILSVSELIASEERLARVPKNRDDFLEILSAVELSEIPPPRDRRLMDLLSALSSRAINDVQAIIYIGRGDYDSYEDAISYVESFSGGPLQIGYLYGKLTGSPEYFEEGLKKLGLLGG